MPRMDRTGPRGLGPGTGWGRGPCVRGLRPRFRRFWRGNYNLSYENYAPNSFEEQTAPIAQASKKEEKQFLEEEMKVLESELNGIKERLKSLE